MTYPLGRSGPEAGSIISIADGVGWARLPVPGSLNHINVWILDDGDGIAIVDTGLKIAPAKEAWNLLFAGPIEGRKVNRVICTHFHPDHVGLAGWLTHKFGVKLWMSRGEWLTARMLTTDIRDTPPVEAFDYWRLAGWDEDRIAAEAGKGWGRFASVVSPIPVSFVRLCDGDRVVVGEREWKVVMGSGHSPEHACLFDHEGGDAGTTRVLERPAADVARGVHLHHVGREGVDRLTHLRAGGLERTHPHHGAAAIAAQTGPGRDDADVVSGVDQSVRGRLEGGGRAVDGRVEALGGEQDLHGSTVTAACCRTVPFRWRGDERSPTERSSRPVVGARS